MSAGAPLALFAVRMAAILCYSDGATQLSALLTLSRPIVVTNDPRDCRFHLCSKIRNVMLTLYNAEPPSAIRQAAENSDKP